MERRRKGEKDGSNDSIHRQNYIETYITHSV